MEAGTKGKEEYIMNYIGVHACFANRKGEILVLQRAETNKYKPLHWDIPGGKMLLDEDVEMAAKREVKEETGLELTRVEKPLSVYVNREQLPTRKDVQIVFACKVKDADAPISINLREHCAYRWIRPSDLPTIPCMAYLAHFYKQVIEGAK